MEGDSGWDNRRMFEQYLYDYLKKNNMHETAEIFKKEANMHINSDTTPEIDVQDGFLREWWLVFYDIFKSRHPIAALYDEFCSSMSNPARNAAQQNVFSSRERDLNEEMIKELTVGGDIGIIITVGNSIENEDSFQDSRSTELQKKESKSMLIDLSGLENVAPNESGENNKNLVIIAGDESKDVQLKTSYSSTKAMSPISSSTAAEVSTSSTSVNSAFLDDKF